MEEEKQDVAAATPQSPVENEVAAPMSGADAAALPDEPRSELGPPSSVGQVPRPARDPQVTPGLARGPAADEGVCPTSVDENCEPDPESKAEDEAAAPLSGADASEEVSAEAAEPPAEAQVDAGEFLLTAEQPVTVAQADAAALKALVEAVVYVLPEPLPAAQIAAALNQPLESVQEALRQLMEEAARPDRGVFVREVAGGYQVATKPEHHEAIRNFVKNLKQPLKLSTAALETLAVIAYKQPVTAPEILEIRGVQGVGVLKTLLERKLITTAGRKNVIGKPILYKTTKEFLTQFGLMSLAELPTLKEFEEIRRQSFAEDDQVPSQEAPSAGLLVDVPALDEPEPAAESQTEWPAGAASETPTEAAPDASAPDVTAEAEAPRVEDDDAGKRDG